MKWLKFGLAFCIILIFSCGEPQIPVADTKTFTLEYDHQQSYDVLAWEKSTVEGAFQQANTVLDFKYDETDLPNSSVRIDSLYEYYFTHVKRDTSGVVMYPGYLCSIERVRDALGNPLDEYWGFTYYPPTPRVGHSFVVLGNPTMPFGCKAKVTIHELGHQRCIVTHLCLDETTMNPAHNDSACVMGKDEIAICTGKDLCSNPLFCEACRNAIKSVSW